MRPQIDIHELSETLPATILRVRGGETVEVMDEGVPVAILAPVQGQRVKQLVARGDATAPAQLTEPLRRFPVTGELSATEAVEGDRAGD